MKGKLRAAYIARLDALSPKEQARLRSAAQRLQREARRAARGRGARRGGPRPNAPLQEWMLEALAIQDREAARAARPSAVGEGLVIRLSRRRATLLVDRGPEGEGERETLRCHLAPALRHAQRSALAVGDRARYHEREDGDPEIHEVLPRRTRLSRPDPHDPGQQRVLVANVDLVLITAAVRHPPLRPGLVDRVLIAVQQGGARAALVLNKVDLLDDDGRAELEAIAARYRDLGLEVLAVSAETGEGVEALRGMMRGQTCAFIGHSGVGKSSLLNALDPDMDIEVGEVNPIIGKGRHTTTGTHLYRLDGDIRVIDTPGIRAFGLWRMSPEELRHAFPEFEEPAKACRYLDCAHLPELEAECGVKQAVRDGRVALARYESYARIAESLED